MRRPSLLLLLLPLLFGCRDTSLLEPPGEPAGAISDAAHAGRIPGFYFLPPLVRTTAYTGTFTATLAPRVEVCVVSGSACSPTSPATEYTTTEGLGGEVIVVDPVNQTYSVNWHTNLSNLDPALAYRVRVWIGSVELGFADVKVVSSGSELKSADTGEQIGLKDGRTLPIKFRIETIVADLINAKGQAFVRDCIASASCVIKHVTPNSTDGTGKQVAKTPDGYFAGVFADGFMDSYVAENPTVYGSGVTVIIQQRPSLPCFPGYPGDQAQGCARYETLPALERGFDFEQRVEECLDPNVQDPESFQLHKLSAIGPVAERGRVVALDRVIAGEIDCASFMQPSTGLEQVAAAVFRPLYRAFGPATAYANDVRYGGLTTSYSDIGHARPPSFDAVSGAGQAGAPGSLLASPIRVRVMQGRDDPSHSPALARSPVQGARVTFIVASGGGTLASPNATTVAAVDSLDNFTDADGYAEVPWTLGQAAGEQTVVVKLPGIGVAELAFSATAGSTAPTLYGPDLVFGFLPTVDPTFAPLRILRNDGAGNFVAPPVDAATGLPTVNVGDEMRLEAWFINAGDSEVDTSFEARLRFDQDPWLSSGWGPTNLPRGVQGYFSANRTLSGPLTGCVIRTAGADLDHANTVAEGNANGSAEGNNTASLSYLFCP